MPWRESTSMSERAELVSSVEAGGKVAGLSRELGVSRKTAYKWLKRYEERGEAGLRNQSTRPRSSPRRSDPNMEALVCALRLKYPAWGGRKLHHVLRREGHSGVPAPSTCSDILRRHGLLQTSTRPQRDLMRFEAAAANDLWQMDFKGHFATGQGRCHPLTVLDDHSRFSICLKACGNEQAQTVQTQLSRAFAEYGLPRSMLMDNGSPWGADADHPHTRLTAWLIRHGITVLHGRPYHPQTQGKEERFHRTLKDELLRGAGEWRDIEHVQSAFDPWRRVYNEVRPHQAIGDVPPLERYQPSPRRFPDRLPEVEYDATDIVRRVQLKGLITFRGRDYLVSRAFIGEPVALRASADGVWDVYYCHQRVRSLVLANV